MGLDKIPLYIAYELSPSLTMQALKLRKFKKYEYILRILSLSLCIVSNLRKFKKYVKHMKNYEWMEAYMLPYNGPWG